MEAVLTEVRAWMSVGTFIGVIFQIGYTYAQFNRLRKDLNGTVADVKEHIKESSVTRENVAVLMSERRVRDGS